MKIYGTIIAAALLLVSGCAPKSWDAEEEGAYDPLEPINRGSYKVHKFLDGVVLKPVAKAYDKSPDFVKTSVGNFYNNLGEPANMVNNALQQDILAATTSLARFGINSTFGLIGLFDVAATATSLSHQPADFGQTLRGYGMDDTSYIFLPLLGPSSFADGVGNGVDIWLSPTTYIDDDGTRVAIFGVGAVHRRAELLEATELAESAALDEYSFIRDAYEDQRRANAPQDLWHGR